MELNKKQLEFKPKLIENFLQYYREEKYNFHSVIFSKSVGGELFFYANNEVPKW